MDKKIAAFQSLPWYVYENTISATRRISFSHHCQRFEMIPMNTIYIKEHAISLSLSPVANCKILEVASN